MEWWHIFFKSVWCGVAACGFGILFNCPQRSLGIVWLGGLLAGLVKFTCMHTAVGAGIVPASFLAAVTIGFASIPAAHFRHVPPTVFAIPAVIPLIPGAFAYRAMLGLMKLATIVDDNYSKVLAVTVNNGTTAFFVILALALGVAVPMHIMRKESVKHLRLRK
jgi:uncharacterized membrane protein YjjB (DUF3815 family)